ncbi:hypothetical protein EN41_25875 [Agrobacterium tumefaciens]|nr:hypothetical protein EN41_25875 [Agrobacterium tumefaciens]
MFFRSGRAADIASSIRTGEKRHPIGHIIRSCNPLAKRLERQHPSSKTKAFEANFEGLFLV